jgi:DNA-binding winged helix-turn-helix (wHTH) protein
MDEIARKVFRFEEFTLDVMRRSLRQGNEDVQLRPKSFDVLCYLVENAGRPLSKDEIIAAAWPKVIVTDESLTRCISDVRFALHDSDQRIIKTIPRQGYAFAAPVHQAAHATSEPVIVPAGLAADRPAPHLPSAAARIFRPPWRPFAVAATC